MILKSKNCNLCPLLIVVGQKYSAGGDGEAWDVYGCGVPGGPKPIRHLDSIHERCPLRNDVVIIQLEDSTLCF